jgi:hypothetical protein
MPFSKRKGEMLVVIGERMGRIDAETFAHLPTGWSVLYWLARLEWETLKNLVEQGIVHPKLRLQDAKRLAIKPWSRPARSPSRKINVTRRLRQFRDFVQRTLSDWQLKERKLARTELTRLLESIEASSRNRSEVHLGDDRTGHRPDIRIFPTHSTATIHLPQQS